eukprot:9427443-Alexandrium_andersonii.AAC.1
MFEACRGSVSPAAACEGSARGPVAAGPSGSRSLELLDSASLCTVFSAARDAAAGDFGRELDEDRPERGRLFLESGEDCLDFLGGASPPLL